jgi:hypothetical protein
VPVATLIGSATGWEDEMDLRLRLTRKRVALLVGLAGLVSAGVAYATIPDAGGVYTACMLKKVGTIRIIDPASQQCSASLETQITFNQKGDPGKDGANGTNGKDGLAPLSARVNLARGTVNSEILDLGGASLMGSCVAANGSVPAFFDWRVSSGGPLDVYLDAPNQRVVTFPSGGGLVTLGQRFGGTVHIHTPDDRTITVFLWALDSADSTTCRFSAQAIITS